MQPRKQKEYIFGDGLFPRLSPASKNKAIMRAIRQGLKEKQSDRKQGQEEKKPASIETSKIPTDGLNQKLLEAAGKGELETVRELLAQGADINHADDFDSTALMAAAYSGYTEIVRELLAKGADINHASCMGETALMAAAYAGHTETVRELLAQGAAINHADNYGNTALIQASLRGHIKTVCELLAQGAAINHHANNGETALIRASLRGHTKTVRELLAQGADIDHPNNYDKTALTLATEQGRTAVVKVIKEEIVARLTYTAKKKEIERFFSTKTTLNQSQLPKSLVDIIVTYIKPA